MSNPEDAFGEQPDFGGLSFVSKGRSNKICAICKADIRSGDPSWNQSDYTTTSPFPVKRNLCLHCGLDLHNKGADIKNPDMYAKNAEMVQNLLKNAKKPDLTSEKPKKFSTESSWIKTEKKKEDSVPEKSVQEELTAEDINEHFKMGYCPICRINRGSSQNAALCYRCCKEANQKIIQEREICVK